MKISDERWFFLLRPKINSLEDSAKEVAFSSLNHSVTSEKTTWSSDSCKKWMIFQLFCLQYGQSIFSETPYVNSSLLVATLLCKSLKYNSLSLLNDFTLLFAKYYLYKNKLAPKELSLDDFKAIISSYQLEVHSVWFRKTPCFN